LESRERRGNKNSKFERPKIYIFKKYWNIPRISHILPKIVKFGPISVEHKDPEFEMVSLSLETVRWLNLIMSQ
jgi:hypothetical protein